MRPIFMLAQAHLLAQGPELLYQATKATADSAARVKTGSFLDNDKLNAMS